MLGREFLPGAVEDGAELVAAGDEAIGDGDVARGARVAESVARLGADAVVPGRVDGAVGDADVLAAVDVDAVAIGVDVEIVDGEVVDAGEQQCEVAALEDGEVAQENVAAVFERDGFVADAGLLGDVDGIVCRAALGCAVGAEAEAFAVDEAGAGDGEVVMSSPQKSELCQWLWP